MSKVAFNQMPGAKYDAIGKITMMARSGGYVMVRRRGAMPFVLSEKKYLALSDHEQSPASPQRQGDRPVSPPDGRSRETNFNTTEQTSEGGEG